MLATGVMWLSYTLGADEDYISFLQSLKELESKPVDADSLETLSMYLAFP